MARPATPKLPKEKTLISEVLQRVSNAKNKASKIKIFKEYDTMALRKVLLCNYSETIRFCFPPGKSPYTVREDIPVGVEGEHTWLMTEHRNIDRFCAKNVNGRWFFGDSGMPKPSIPQLRKEQLWVQLLENLHPDEAEVLDLVKDKKINSKYKITKQNVVDAFTDLLQ